MSMSIDALLNIVIWIIVLGAICGLLWWLIDFLGTPAPFNRVAKGVVAVVAVIFLIKILLGLVSGHGLSFSLLTGTGHSIVASVGGLLLC